MKPAITPASFKAHPVALIGIPGINVVTWELELRVNF
jgi:hypothetical protein